MRKCWVDVDSLCPKTFTSWLQSKTKNKLICKQEVLITGIFRFTTFSLLNNYVPCLILITFYCLTCEKEKTCYDGMEVLEKKKSGFRSDIEFRYLTLILNVKVYKYTKNKD